MRVDDLGGGAGGDRLGSDAGRRAGSSTGAAAAAAAPAITAADLKAIKTPSADDRAKGDPDGSLTGTAVDVTVVGLEDRV